MEEVDFDEKAFDMIGSNAPQDVKDAWMEAAKEENYLLKRVAVYRIRKEMFEGGYLKPGEQYLQLRYLPGEVK